MQKCKNKSNFSYDIIVNYKDVFEFVLYIHLLQKNVILSLN